ncbi:low specificity L-threonine aldolase [Aureimonas fodinaquatilis]|uniref:L-threonine aldolase n=1 Tax=Aureimonas fodinaquatilis TaxID=2565783 RepID=A0A5B0E307_9HYPH|nr:low specificity L-threonine aldolase [Aureimonas fodinaquatilis]KAA0972525.1 low specificity L-threonine aldolase [Aureimonas fodinaquatilis]
MFFASDNWSGVHPAIAASLNQHSQGAVAAYGQSALDRQVAAQFNEVFEREVAVYFVGTGTAANALALSAYNRPGGVVLCHAEAHIHVDECGAPEFFSPGAKLAAVSGAHGLMNSAALASKLAGFDPQFVHGGQPMAISVSQPGEAGTLYSAAALAEISQLAHQHALPLHMDGARFANALVATGLTPAQMTWQAGVDVMSFGGTKNGCWCAEAVVFFNPEQARQFPYIRKRSAQLFSKSRFIAAQFLAYFQNNLWLELAAHSNAMATLLRQAINSSPTSRLAWDGTTNEAFVIVPNAAAERLQAAGSMFYDWPVPDPADFIIQPDERLLRLVTSWSTSQQEIEQFSDFLD